MELVFRGNKAKGDDFYNLYAVLREDGSVQLTIKTKNATGESTFTLLPTDFDMLCEIRTKVREIKSF